MRFHTPAIFTALAALTAAPAPGHRPGTVELGAFGRYTRFDRSLGWDNAFGGGGRLGVFIAPLEVSAAYVMVNGPLNTNIVVDGLDACRNTPEGDAVDDRGCSLPKDADSDGVVDAADRSPNTPLAERVNTAGCALDSDGDGVPDALDQCANTPAGTMVDAIGCELTKDSDGDGVMDPADKWPGTTVGERVDAIGCPVLFLERQRSIVLEGVNFETASANLTDQSYVTLNRVATSLAAASRAPGRSRGLHRQPRERPVQSAVVAVSGRSRPGVSHPERGRSGPAVRERLRRERPDRLEHHHRRPGPESARGAASAELEKLVEVGGG